MAVQPSRHRTRRTLVPALATLVAAVGGAGLATSPAHAAATTYYVDAAAGSDSNAGTSSAAPWQSLAKVNATAFQPGDTVAFKAGATWNGRLVVSSSGTAATPVTFTSYGSGSKPLIAGGGGGTTAVTLDNVHDVTLDGLEVTNSAGDLSVQTASSRGVLVLAKDLGTDSGITVRNLHVHHIDGQGKSDIGQGGIVVMARGSSTPTSFAHLHLLDNEVDHANAYGITMISNWCAGGCAYFSDQSGDTDPAGAFTPSTDVLVQGNHVHDVSGGGIQTSTTQSAVIQNNTVDRAVTNRLQYGGGNVGIWWQNDRDTLVQHNVVANTALNNFNVDNQDDQAFDADEDTRRSIVQGNFSVNNAGGFFLACCGGGGDAVLRYNVSQHDLFHTFTLTDGSYRIRIYGNTVWGTADTQTQWQPPSSGNAEHGGTTRQVGLKTIVDTSYDGASPDKGDIGVYDNVFYNPANVPFNALGGQAHYSHNLYYGGSGITPTVPADDPAAITADPQLTAPGNAAVPTSALTDSQLASLLSGYALGSGSPARNQGLSAGALSTTTAPTNPYGTAVPAGAVDLGAWQHPVSATASTDLGTSIGNASAVTDGNQSTSWASADTPALPGTVTVSYGEARTMDAVDVAAAFGQGQGPTNVDVRTWNGSAWTTQVTGAALTWNLDTSTVEHLRIPLPATVTTTGVQLVVHAANTTWGHLALSEIRPSYGTFASTSQDSYAGLGIQNAVDGNTSTSWATGTPTYGTDGVSIDTGTPQSARTLRLSAAFGQGQGPTNVSVLAFTPAGNIQVAGNVPLTWNSNTGTVETRSIALTTPCANGVCYTPSRYILMVNSANTTWGHWAVNELALLS
ncbi:discoidin domain-containing protein [Kitasatospora cineracea]|uniref:F5/8 type C domain-containing protein n=1 Tax=Kitasatospora cineracea TaxID=88074 RepID=A0A3N4RRV8_9ACTN|nr:discoidin domain-containing protein [Kitasatospora cineracea]RPE36162.1 F5/8 type C domain-containing protein [Kitasatospora cineracea]